MSEVDCRGHWRVTVDVDTRSGNCPLGWVGGYRVCRLTGAYCPEFGSRQTTPGEGTAPAECPLRESRVIVAGVGGSGQQLPCLAARPLPQAGRHAQGAADQRPVTAEDLNAHRPLAT